MSQAGQKLLSVRDKDKPGVARVNEKGNSKRWANLVSGQGCRCREPTHQSGLSSCRRRYLFLTAKENVVVMVRMRMATTGSCI